MTAPPKANTVKKVMAVSAATGTLDVRLDLTAEAVALRSRGEGVLVDEVSITCLSHTVKVLSNQHNFPIS